MNEENLTLCIKIGIFAESINRLSYEYIRKPFRHTGFKRIFSTDNVSNDMAANLIKMNGQLRNRYISANSANIYINDTGS